MLRVIAFDTFGTVFDLSRVPHQEKVDYLDHIHEPQWSPLELPKTWRYLPAHPDSAEGIAKLREKYMVVTCSNGPLGLLIRLSKFHNICWDGIIPLEMNKVFKPNPAAYMTICEIMDVEPSEVLMVTANEKFGDLEASRSLGMEAQLIRKAPGPMTIVELSERLK